MVKQRKGAGNMEAMNINQAQFEQMVGSGKTILVDFWAPWCGYCRRIAPAYDQIGERYGHTLVVAKVNIDDEPHLAEAEQIEVIPTLVLYRDGKSIGSLVAPESKAVIDQFIRETLAK